AGRALIYFQRAVAAAQARQSGNQAKKCPTRGWGRGLSRSLGKSAACRGVSCGFCAWPRGILPTPVQQPPAHSISQPGRPRRHPEPDRCRALELLASSRDGATEAIMRAHGFTVAQMVELVRAG